VGGVGVGTRSSCGNDDDGDDADRGAVIERSRLLGGCDACGRSDLGPCPSFPSRPDPIPSSHTSNA